MKISHLLLLSVSLLPFQVHAMDPYGIVEKDYGYKITYSPGVFNYYKEGTTLSTLPQRPQKTWNQNSLIYSKKSQDFTQETVLKKVVYGQDGREHISNTTAWPYSIHAQLSMVFNGRDYGGSGSMVGPHHLLTCGHCVYDFDKSAWAQEISVYPALNGEMAPFGCVKVTKAYVFKSWQGQGNQQFDMALLLLDQPIGDYTGWGGLLSTSDTELSQEKVHITGYPGDKGFKQMWSMSHQLKTVKPEQFDYEHDTYGGQSGSGAWINKYGMPMISGVHTLGSNDINSGVRLSGQKFTNLLLKVISETYNLNKGLITIVSELTPIIQPSDLQKGQEKQKLMDEIKLQLQQEAQKAQEAEAEVKKLAELQKKQEMIAIRASMIDECMNQYKALKSSSLIYSQLYDACMRLYSIYDERLQENKEKKVEDKGCAKIFEVWLMADDGRKYLTQQCKNSRCRVEASQYDVFKVGKNNLLMAMKFDILESMELYKELYGQPHPRWEEFRKM